MTSTHRNRLLNAVIFFASSIKHCGKIKLFKLLYLLDFEHFRQTGKSVTGVEYQAWKFDPVPIELMEEWDQMEADLARLIHIVPERIIDYTRETVKVNDGVEFDDEDFTPRQIRIMESLAEKYCDTYSPTMIDVTHEQNGAWDRVWHGGKGARQVIPYEYSLSDDELGRDELLAIAAEQQMYTAALHAACSVAPENA